MSTLPYCTENKVNDIKEIIKEEKKEIMNKKENVMALEFDYFCDLGGAFRWFLMNYLKELPKLYLYFK